MRRPDFNAENKEVQSRYVKQGQCHYIVDMAVEGQSETRFDLLRGWDVVVKRPFLDVSKSRFPFKTFYLPFLSASRNHYNDYICEMSLHPQLWTIHLSGPQLWTIHL